MSYSKWLNSARDKIKIKQESEKCLRVISDYLNKVVADDPKFQKMRDYFYFLDNDLGDFKADQRDVLKTFRSFRRHVLRKIDPIEFQGRCLFFGTDIQTESISEKDWKRDRTKSLDQYVRYICGVPSEYVINADYLRMVYTPLILEAKAAKVPFEVRVEKDLICLDNSISAVWTIMVAEKYQDQLGIKSCNYDGETLYLLFERKSR